MPYRTDILMEKIGGRKVMEKFVSRHEYYIYGEDWGHNNSRVDFS